MGEAFRKFKEALTKRIDIMLEAGDAVLFRSSIPYEDMWKTYLDAFPSGTNDIYRVRTEHDCACCRHFIRDFGDVLVSHDGVTESIWDIQDAPYPYNIICEKMAELVKGQIRDIFWSRDKKIGTDHSIERLDVPMTIGTEKLTTIRYEHFYYEIPDRYFQKYKGRSRGDYSGDFESMVRVLLRSVTEITKESIETVLDLIKDNSLYRGAEWGIVLGQFLGVKCHYGALLETDSVRASNYIWESAAKYGPVISKIRNHSIGTLLVDISEGMDLEKAVSRYEQIVAPANYKRPKEIYTKKMLEDAKAELQNLGYIDSLPRRYAVKDDIPIANMYYYNASAASEVHNGDIFDEMAASACVAPKKFSNAPTMTFEEFKSSIMPTATSIEVLFENRHRKNLMSLIAPENRTAKSMFKWDNGISWAYSGNMTDSNIKENVQTAGGTVDCDVRFSIQWNDRLEQGWTLDDLDAHVIEIGGGKPAYEIYYGNRSMRSPRGGMLDVDIQHPSEGKAAVENIFHKDVKALKDCKLRFGVHMYAKRNGFHDGFRAELDILGDTYEFDYTKDIKNKEFVQVAEVQFDSNAKPTVNLLIPDTCTATNTTWSITTNTFYPVSMVLPSPNYWNGAVGNEHIFFIIPGAVNSEMPNAFYNEFLDERLSKYKRFMAALGGRLKVSDSEHQLSGIGFSKTIHNSVIVRVNGRKVINVTF